MDILGVGQSQDGNFTVDFCIRVPVSEFPPVGILSALIPSNIYIYFLWRKSLDKNRLHNCKTSVIQKAYGLFSVVVYVYIFCLDTHSYKFHAYSYSGQ